MVEKKIEDYIKKVISRHKFCNKHKLGHKDKRCPLCINEEIAGRMISGKYTEHCKTRVGKYS